MSIEDPEFNLRSLGGNIDKIREYMDRWHPSSQRPDKAINLLCDLIIALEIRIRKLEKSSGLS